MLERLEAAGAEYGDALRDCQANAGTIFREKRDLLKLTQSQFATRLGTNSTYVSKIENGHVEPGLETFKRLLAIIREGAK